MISINQHLLELTTAAERVQILPLMDMHKHRKKIRMLLLKRVQKEEHLHPPPETKQMGYTEIQPTIQTPEEAKLPWVQL